MTEAILQRKIKNFASANGALCLKLVCAGVVGFPDLFIARGGGVVLLELKNPNGNGRLSKMQGRMITKLERAGIAVYVTNNLEEAKTIIDRLPINAG
jgi:hypothetical protein